MVYARPGRKSLRPFSFLKGVGSMDQNFSVIRSTRETSVVKPDVLTSVPTVFCFYSECVEQREIEKSGAESGRARPRQVALAAVVFRALDPHLLQGCLWFGKDDLHSARSEGES